MPLSKPQNIFGRLVKFWRQSFALSQEELAYRLGVSTRHLSFLECGRARPNRELVLALVDKLGLGIRDCNNLLNAAGLSPEPVSVDLEGSDDSSLRLREYLKQSLAAFGPYPASINDILGNIRMVNQPWLAAMAPYLADIPYNYHHLFLSPNGARPQLANWESLARVLLLALQQEVIITGDPEQETLLAELLAYPGIPKDWAISIDRSRLQLALPLHLCLDNGELAKFELLMHKIAANPPEMKPRLMISVLMPANPAARDFIEQLPKQPPTAHPLLA
ncbi:MAG: helix-turn-helix domain-containing protein [Motiliproteus sp.]